VVFFALLIAYPWWVLSIGTLAYLASLPFGWLAYRDYQRKDAAAAESAGAPAQAALRVAEGTSPSPAHPEDHPERPARLN
jgi:CDP-diacylglycerol--serine O-phosphatidyltransferase